MIYFDNSATTPLSRSAKEKILEMCEKFGNPSSLHSAGLEAEKEVTLARERVAKSLSSRPDEIYFTSSGTEADNIAIFGSAKKNIKVGKKILTTDSEHPAVSECIKALEGEGWSVVRLKTRGGKIDMSEVKSALSPDIALVSIMHTNNETGAVYDVKGVSDLVKSVSPRAIVHSDAVQSYMKEKVTLSSLGADIISISAHKVHAPKGVGALVVKRGLVIPPHTFGGGQERGVRSGTENTIGISAFGASVAELSSSGAVEKMRSLREYIIERLSPMSEVKLNLPEKASPSIINFSLVGWRSEIILHKLSMDGIFVSSGSACSSKKGKSGVLEAFGLTPREADGAIRVSLSGYNTREEADLFINAVGNATKTIKKQG